MGIIQKHKYPSDITKLNQIEWVQGIVLNCLPWFSSGSTTNSTLSSGSTFSVGWMGSLSFVLVPLMHEWVYALVWCHGCAWDIAWRINGTTCDDAQTRHKPCQTNISTQLGLKGTKQVLATKNHAARISHEIHWAYREHENKIKRVGLAAKSFL